MNLRIRLITAAGILAVLALAALLAGGCSSGGTPAVTTGVTGYVVDATSGQGIGNMTVTVGGVTGVSTTPDGAFTVKAAPGLQRAVAVQPTALFVEVPGAQLYVDVVVGQITSAFYNLSSNPRTYNSTILVVDPHSLPPSG